MSTIENVCSTCKHYPSDEHCKGCIFNLMNSSGNINWSLKVLEPEEPFINKPCVSEGVCREDKMKVLNKIVEELADMEKEFESRHDYPRADTLKDSISIINKYMAESEIKNED